MSDPDAETVARRLGLTETVICRLRAHGQLERCALSGAEIDRRLFEAHLAFVCRDLETMRVRALSKREVTDQVQGRPLEGQWGRPLISRAERTARLRHRRSHKRDRMSDYRCL